MAALSRAHSLEGRPPAESLEAGIVPIRGDPFASRFNGEGSEPGILDEIAGGAALAGDVAEDLPVPGAGMDPMTMRLREQDARTWDDIP
jgi:hypothetical protein